jgi:Ran GTPase-activating protein (RanGAP) involved in mRNA processing and transport
LRKLWIASTNVDLVTLGPSLRGMIELQLLDLSHNKLDAPDTWTEFKTIVECTTKLYYLDVSDCQISPEGVEEVFIQVTTCISKFPK